MKNISIFYPQDKFTSEQLQKLEFAGKVSFTDNIKNCSLKEIIRISKNADIVAINPIIGEDSSIHLSEILKKSSNIKGLALNSTNISYFDKQYCKERNIAITVVPNCATTQAVAEQTLLLLLGSTKRIFINGYKAQKRNFQQELGNELFGKTLGIIGINNISEEIVKLAKPFGLRIFVWNDIPMRLETAHRKSLEEVLTNSDFITINLPETETNKKFLSKEKISIIKKNAVLINLSSRTLIDETAIFEALKNRNIDQYIYETNRLTSSPLQNTEYAIAFKPISKHTQESKNRSQELWVNNIVALSRNTPINLVN